MNWYIDALDGLGGLAFASYRDADLTGDAPDLSGAAWVIGTPDFEPRPLSSRVTGWAATRRGLQLGFSVGEETEVAFPSLAAMTDFVRRVYIAGGGGDGGGGIVPRGGDWPPEPEGGGDRPLDFPLPFESFGRCAGPLLAFTTAHTDRTEEATEAGKTAIAVDEMTTDAGAVEMPGPLDLAKDLIGYGLDARWRVVDEGDPEALHALRMSTIAYCALTQGLRVHYEARWFNPGSYRDALRTGIFGDPLDMLSSLPIPVWVAQSPDGREHWRSVKDLFFAVLANPALLIDPDHGADRAVLFLFASVVQLRCGAPFGFGEVGDGAVDPEYTVLMAEVLEWLRPQMPKYAFTSEIEAAIREMARQVS